MCTGRPDLWLEVSVERVSVTLATGLGDVEQLFAENKCGVAVVIAEALEGPVGGVASVEALAERVGGRFWPQWPGIVIGNSIRHAVGSDRRSVGARVPGA